MLSKSTQNPESKRKTLSCRNKICILPPIGSIPRAEPWVDQSPPCPVSPRGFGQGTAEQGGPWGGTCPPLAAPVPLVPPGLRGQPITQQLAVGFLRRAGEDK